MNVSKAVVTVVACTVLLAVLGGSIGFALGTHIPEYYRSLFRGGHLPEFNPVSVGVGLGVGQGAAGGAVVGVALVLILAWYDLKRCIQKGKTDQT